MNDKTLQKETHKNLGYVYYQGCKFDAAVKSYLKVQEISRDLGERKEEANACLMLGDIFQELKQHEKAIASYQTTLNISEELEDKEMQVVSIHKLGTLYLTLASICSKDYNYEKAIKWYEKALDISRIEPIDRPMHEKALTGLGIAWLNLGNNEKAIESIDEVQQFAKMEADMDSSNVETTHEQKTSTVQEESSSQVPEGWARFDALIEEACNPSRTETLSSEDVVHVKKYVEEIAPSYVYTREISVKEPFTKIVRKAMTEKVKKSACTSLLGKDDNKLDRKDGELVKGDQQIFNFARDEVFKNASTKKPARLNETLASYMRSIGNIKCGSVGGTCFLVTDVLVITNYHVYRMIEKERKKSGNSSLHVSVLFDYLYDEQMENVVEVEVDEEQDLKLANPYLDYKFFRLKQNDGIRGRVPLGPMVRKWQLSDGRVVILGHPGGKEMQDEVCVVVGYHAMQERIRERYEQCTGVHMTNAQ
ncbi:tetratricopeptide repeat [Paramuricea clavata]|uniref:Tetratricopeptide repeat n=1 Tax=Paramuricea clavata TaxID=317549 RepID=A0A6S7IS09_PARCT|nr:tetratricopeptide repeat [Paramuricea clavata]